MTQNKIVVGTRKGLMILEKSGSSWALVNESHLGARVPYAVVDGRTDKLYACLDHGHWGPKLHSSSDYGSTWDELETPQYPESARLKGGKPAVLKYLWYLAPGGQDEPERLYIGTEPGGLFESNDGGRSFHLVESLWNQPSREEMWMGGGLDEPGIHSVIIDPRQSSRIITGVSVAGVFYSDDHGTTWQTRNKGLLADYLPNPDVEIGHDPHFVVQCQGNPDVLWQQNHCGIFRTTDCGQKWERVSEVDGPAHFGFTIAADPANDQTAWVIPMVSDEVRIAYDRKLFVSRTEDGGKTWQRFGEGLPQENCYDFVFRHGLDISDNHLVFGTACGSIYLSSDRGESWQTLMNNLPPVYSVRFA